MVETHRRCSKCSETKPIESFYRNRNSRGGRLASCKVCQNAATRECREKNPGYLESKRRWRRENPEKVRAHKRAEYARDAEKIKARVQRWRHAKPDMHRANNLRRRALECSAAGAGYTTSQHIEMRFAMWGGKCRYCGCVASSVDHRIPLVRGGSHWPANLVPCCTSCNSKKNSKTEFEFLRG